MDKHKQNIIKNIAQELDCGFDVYFDVKTEEMISIPSFSYTNDDDEFLEAFEPDLKKIEEQKSDFIKFEVLQSFDSFKIMELFVAQLTDQNFKETLKIALANKKPFLNFKNKIDSSHFRQHWFDFKQKELEKIVEKQLEIDTDSAQQK